LGEGVYPSASAKGPASAVSSLVAGSKITRQKSNFLHFSIKILHLVAPILLIFLRVTDHSV